MLSCSRDRVGGRVARSARPGIRGGLLVLAVAGLAGIARAQPAAPAPEAVAQLDAELLDVAELIANAHFRSALSLASSAGRLLDTLPAAPETRARRVRLEILSGTAALALGRRAQALRHFSEAQRVDPAFEPDPATTSPKILDAWAASRETSAP